MHTHKRFNATTDPTGDDPGRRGPGFPDRGGRGDRFDRFGGTQRGRGGGRGRGRRTSPTGSVPTSGATEGFGPGFGPPDVRAGPQAGPRRRPGGDHRPPGRGADARLPDHHRAHRAQRGRLAPSPGSVYPTLQAMEDQGLVTADKSEGRRVFSLTEAGRAVAEEAGDGPAPWEDAARRRRPVPGRPAEPHGRGGRGHHAGGPGRERAAGQGGG